MSLTVDEIARHTLVTCGINDDLTEISKIMLKQNVGSVLVMDMKKEVVGIITKNDVLRQLIAGRNLKTTVAKDVMSHPVAFCNRTDTVEEALKKFQDYSRLAVKGEDGKIVGVVKKKIVERFAQVSLAYNFVQRRVQKPGD